MLTKWAYRLVTITTIITITTTTTTTVHTPTPTSSHHHHLRLHTKRSRPMGREEALTCEWYKQFISICTTLVCYIHIAYWSSTMKTSKKRSNFSMRMRHLLVSSSMHMSNLKLEWGGGEYATNSSKYVYNWRSQKYFTKNRFFVSSWKAPHD